MSNQGKAYVLTDAAAQEEKLVQLFEEAGGREP